VAVVGTDGGPADLAARVADRPADHRPGPRLAAEDEPWATDAPPLVAGGVDALTELERRVLAEPGGMRGVVLRYGFFYGPTTWWAQDGDVAAQVRGGGFRIVDPGTGVWSFVHIDDAVAATVAAVTSDSHGAFNINDDDPLPIDVWLPAYAKWVDAPPPLRVPAGPGTDADAHFYANRLRGADNSRARRELGFSPRRLEWLDAAEPGTADRPVRGKAGTYRR
jgi:2-alkyl-3-oxoalkanoate reductase